MRRLRALVVVAAIGPASAAGAEEMTLRAISSFPEGAADSQTFEALISDINRRGAGKIRINYLGGAPKLMSPFEVVKNLRDGVVDMANANGAFFTNVLPEADAFKLSELSIAELRKNGGWAYMNNLFNDKANAWFLGNHLEGVTFNIYLNKQIARADLTGLRIRVSPIYRAMVEALGGTAITSAPSDAYTMLQRGTVDGYGWPTAGIFDYSFQKVTKYRVEPAFYSTALHTLVNLNTWRKLGPERQEILVRAMTEAEKVGSRTQLNEAERKRQEEAGIVAIQLPPAEAAKWLRTAKESAWAVVIKVSPEHGPKLRQFLTKN